jgi:hypothetical protein
MNVRIFGKLVVFSRALTAVALVGVSLLGCTDDYPPCTPGDGAGGSTTWVVSAGPGVTAASGGDWAEPEEEHGYSRNASGEVCSCDAEDDAQRSCVEAPPKKPSLPVCGSEADTGEGFCMTPPGEMPDQQTQHQCGNVYWCCSSLRCENGAKLDTYDFPICGRDYGQDDTRAGAWKGYQGHLLFHFEQLKKENGLCWIREASCYAKPTGVRICGNYPN